MDTRKCLFYAASGMDEVLLQSLRQHGWMVSLARDAEEAQSLKIQSDICVGLVSIGENALADWVAIQNVISFAGMTWVALVNPGLTVSRELLQLLAKCGGTPVAYWGHGRNFQAAKSASLASSFKNLLATKVHWWFAYNELSASVVRNLGYPENRITSVGNAIDTTGLIERKNSLTAQELDTVRDELGLHSENVAVYTGGLYPNKRIDFLLDAAALIRKTIPDFELIVIGDGPDRNRISAAASQHPWIHDVGPKNDRAKVPYWALSKLLLMPGGVGLVVLDSFALGVPMVTTDTHLHGPEIDYLESAVNGLLVPCGNNVEIYASEIVNLFLNPEQILRLQTAASASAAKHSIEAMARNFTEGVLLALDPNFTKRSGE
jgi:glycosyltransferase involved in cell wall biosynthesis